MNKALVRFYTLFFLFVIVAPAAFAQRPSLAWGAGTSYPLGGTVSPNGVAYDASGNVYVTGEFAAMADLDPGSGTYNLVSNGGKDIFVASYTSAGAFRWAKGIGSSYDDGGRAIAVDASGNVYITGSNLGASMNFDPGATSTSSNTVYPYSSSTNDVFVASYTSNGAFRWVKEIGSNGDEYGYGITADASGFVTIFGNFSSASVNFNPGNTSTAPNTPTLVGNTDMYMASYTNTGIFRWAKGLGSTNAEYASGIASDASGNIFITGSTTSTAVNFNPSGSAYSTVYGNFDIFLASYDNTGAYRWHKSMGSTSTDEGFGVAVDGFGNVSMTGTYIYANVNFNPGSGSTSANTPGTFGGTYPYDVFVANYSNTGTFRWVKGFGGTGQDYGYGIAADALGNVITTGISASTGVNYNPGFSSNTSNTFSAYGNDIFAVSYDVNGNFNWAKDIGSAGGSGKGFDVATGPGNTVAIAGTFAGTSDFNPGGTPALLTGATTNGFVLQVSSAGAYSNAVSLGFYGSSTIGMTGNGVTYDAAGNSFATGYFNNALVNFGTAAAPLYASSKGSDDLYIVSYDPAGAVRWLKTIGGSGSERATAITIDGSGNVYVTGSNSSAAVNFEPGTASTASNTISAPAGGNDIFLASYTGNGTFRWVKEMGGSGFDQGLAIAADGSGNVFITGANNSPSVNFDPGNASTSSNTVSTAGSYDIFIASYTGTGTFRWVKDIGGSNLDQGYGIATDATGNVYLAGLNSSASVNFDPGATTTPANTVSANSGDIVIASYSGAGAFRWVKEIGGSGYEYGYAITTDAGGNVYCTGENASTSVNFDPAAASTATNTVSASAATQDIFIASYSSAGAFRWVKDIAGSGYEIGKGIAADGSANIYLTGNTSGSGTNFDPGATSTAINTPPTVGGNDIFIASYGSTGTFRWAKNLGSTGTDVGNAIAASSAGTFYLTGQVGTSIANLEPFGSNYIAATPAPGIFIAAYTQCSGPLVPTAGATTLSQSIASGTNATTIHDACNYIATLKPTGTTTALSGTVSATAYVESSVPTYNSKAYVARHYDILPATIPNTATANVTLYFTQQEFTDYNVANGTDPDLPAGPVDATGIAALRVTQEHGSSATGMPGSYTYTGSGAHNVLIDPADANIVWNADAQRWEVTFPVTGFSGFFVSGNTGAPLPVRLLSFTASKATNSSNRVDWNTAAEDAGTSFEVTRSGNGASFERLGAVAGKGNNASYTFYDQQPLSGINYYRLKMTEASGESAYSNIAIVRSGGNAGSVTIAPQPAANTLTITNTDASLTGKTAIIFDMQGREMLRFAMEAIRNIDIRTWAAGIYTLRLPSGDAVRISKQ